MSEKKYLKNLKVLKPLHIFSFGFVLCASLIAIMYSITFGFSEKVDTIDTTVDVVPSAPFQPGVYSTEAHKKLVEQQYSEERDLAELKQETAVPAIPEKTSLNANNAENEAWEGSEDGFSGDSPIDDLSDVPVPESPEPPTLDLTKMNSWEPPPFDGDSINASPNNQDESTQASKARVEEKLKAITVLVKQLNENKPSPHQPQEGSYWSQNPEGESNIGNGDHIVSEQAIPATSRFLCRTTHAINNKVSSVRLVEAECMDGVMKGLKIQGNFTLSGETYDLEFNKIISKGGSVPFKGYAIDPKTKVIGLASEVDRHTLSRNLALMSSSFLEGIGALVGGTKIRIENDVVATETQYDTKDRLTQGISKIGDRYASKAEEYYDTPATVKVRNRQLFTLMVVEDVPTIPGIDG